MFSKNFNENSQITVFQKKQNLAERKPKRPTVTFQKEKIQNDLKFDMGKSKVSQV